MTSGKRAILVVAALAVLAVMMAGCGGKTVATVNGEKISREEYDKAVERETVGVQNPVGPMEAGVWVLTKLINQKIIEQLAKKEGVPPTNEQIEYKWGLLKKSGNLKRLTQVVGMTEDEIRQMIAASQSYINVLTKGIKVTDKQVSDLYYKNRSKFRQPERVRVRMIITAGEQKSKKAEGFLKRGIEFETVAREQADNPLDRQNGGAVAVLSKGMKVDNVPPEIMDKIVDVAFKTKIRQRSPRFLVQGKTSGGPLQRSWIILKVEDVLPAEDQKLPQVKESLREGLALEQARQKPDIGKRLANFDKKAKVEVEIERYKPVIKILRERIRPAQPSGPMPTPGEAGGPPTAGAR